MGNEYHLLSMYEGIDPKMDFLQQEDDLLMFWERDSDFYDSITAYNENNLQEGLIVKESTDDCDSKMEIECSLKGALIN